MPERWVGLQPAESVTLRGNRRREGSEDDRSRAPAPVAASVCQTAGVRGRRLVAVSLVVLLTGAACGSDDGGSDAGGDAESRPPSECLAPTDVVQIVGIRGLQQAENDVERETDVARCRYVTADGLIVVSYLAGEFGDDVDEQFGSFEEVYGPDAVFLERPSEDELYLFAPAEGSLTSVGAVRVGSFACYGTTGGLAPAPEDEARGRAQDSLTLARIACGLAPS